MRKFIFFLTLVLVFGIATCLEPSVDNSTDTTGMSTSFAVSSSDGPTANYSEESANNTSDELADTSRSDAMTSTSLESNDGSAPNTSSRSDSATNTSSEWADETIAVTVSSPRPPDRARVCKSCTCHEELTFTVNCTRMNLDTAFLQDDWPYDVRISSVYAIFDENEFVKITQFPELPITKLSFRNNAIRNIQRGAFKLLKNLELLDLSENKLTHDSLTRDVFEGRFDEKDYEPLQLKALKLGYNKINSINKDAFDHIASHLQRLELNNNPLKIIDHQTAMAISGLRQLKVLNLAQTKLSSIPDGLFHALQSLERLLLNGNKFRSVPKDLQNAVHLEYLNFNDNPVRFLDAGSFQGLVALRGLNISCMPNLTSIGINTFTPLTSLINLWCSYNPVLAHVNSGAFNSMALSDGTLKLNKFHFRGNRVPFLSPQLLPWSDIDTVDLEDSSFICDCKIGWMVKDLIPVIYGKTPEAAITCRGPEEYKGRTLISLQQDKSIVSDCNSPYDMDTDNGNHDGDSSIAGGKIRPAMSASFNFGLLAVSLFGIVAVIGGVACMAVIAIRKNHLRQMFNTGQIVHYVRTPGGTDKVEDEQVIVEREFTQYDEDP